MAEKEEGNAPTERLTGWLGRAQNLLAMIIALAGILPQIVPGLGTGRTQLIALILALGAVGWLAWSAYRHWVRPRPAPRDRAKHSIQIRGLKPFEDGDELFGRDREVGELLTTVRSMEFRFGFLSGEAGAGKTSLLRAGLTSALRKASPTWTFVYVPRSGARPDQEILTSLKAHFPIEAGSGAGLADTLARLLPARDGPLVIACDQFEEFFLAARSSEARNPVIAEFQRLWHMTRESGRLRLLICLRKEFVDDLMSLATHLPDLRIQDWRCALANFSEETAEELVAALVETGELNISPQVQRRLPADLATDGYVRPVEFQIVLTRLLSHNVRTLKDYEARGYAAGLLSRYINETISPPDMNTPEVERQAGRHLLRTLCSESFVARRPEGLSLRDLSERVREQMAGADGSNQFRSGDIDRAVARMVTEFLHARVLMKDGEDRYNLTHDYLAPAIRDATADIETAEDRANRLLDQFLAQSRVSRSTLLPWRAYRSVTRYASPDRLARPEAKRLVRRSRQRAALLGVAGGVALVAVATAALPFGWHNDVTRVELESPALVSEKPPLVIAGNDPVPTLHRLDTPTAVTEIPVQSIAQEFSTDGDQLLFLGSNGTVYLARKRDGFKPIPWIVNTGWRDDLFFMTQWSGFSEDGKSGFVIDVRGQIYVWRLDGPPRPVVTVPIPWQDVLIEGRDERATRTVRKPQTPDIVALGPGGTHMVVGLRKNDGDDEMYLVDTRRRYSSLGSPTSTFSSFRSPHKFSPDGKRLAWADAEGQVWVQDLISPWSKREVIARSRPSRSPSYVIFSPDSQWLVVRYSFSDFYQWKVGTPPATSPAVDFPERSGSDRGAPGVFDAKSRYVLAEGSDGFMHLWALRKPPGAGSRPLHHDFEDRLRRVGQGGHFCPGADSLLLAAKNGLLFRVAGPAARKPIPAGRMAVGDISFRIGARDDFVLLYNSSEIAFGKCSEGDLAIQRFDLPIEKVLVSEDRRELLVLDKEGVTRVKRSFYLWGLPIRQMIFPELASEPSARN